jgi:hypothetical protein
MMVSLLRGRLLHLWPTTLQLMRSSHGGGAPAASGGRHGDDGMVAGTLFLCGSCLSYALWFIVQVHAAVADHWNKLDISIHACMLMLSF